MMCEHLTEVDIPSTVTRIKSYTFSGCTALTNVVLHNTLTSIGDAAFHSNDFGFIVTDYVDISVAIPDSVEYVGSLAFQGATIYISHEDSIPSGWSNTWGDNMNRVLKKCTLQYDQHQVPYVESIVNEVVKPVQDEDGVYNGGYCSIGGVYEVIKRIPQRPGYEWLGWATERGSTTVAYGASVYTASSGEEYLRHLSPEELIAMPSPTTLYAIWRPIEYALE